MPIHLQREIEKLKKQALALCAQVEDAVSRAVRAVAERDAELAREVIERDVEIDRAEIEVEEECLKMLALYQPVAIDLRFIVAVLKLNNDLERIGDLAVNIAQRAQLLARHVPIETPPDFSQLAQKAQAMLRRSIEALIHMRADLAREVCAMDDEVDAINRRMYDQLKERMIRKPDQISSHLALLSASRALERIADHATNIAEDVLYMVEGHIARHARRIPRPAQPGTA